MANPMWTRVAERIGVEAKPPSGVWTKVCDYIGPKRLIKIEVVDDNESWEYSQGTGCGANGDLTGNQTDRMIAGAPVGALIGKIGGSTAVNEADNTLFVAGTLLVMRLKDTQEGPLYLTINDSLAGLADNSKVIHVNVYEAL